jgi:hypothetical protein
LDGNAHLDFASGSRRREHRFADQLQARLFRKDVCHHSRAMPNRAHRPTTSRTTSETLIKRQRSLLVIKLQVHASRRARRTTHIPRFTFGFSLTAVGVDYGYPLTREISAGATAKRTASHRTLCPAGADTAALHRSHPISALHIRGLERVDRQSSRVPAFTARAQASRRARTEERTP